MSRRVPRWNWLGFLVICNLIVWIGVAIGIGVLATDRVNLGVESFIRTQQATMVAAWNQGSNLVVDRAAVSKPQKTATAIAAPTQQAAKPAAVRPTATRASVRPAATVALIQPAATVSPVQPARPAAPTAQPTAATKTMAAAAVSAANPTTAGSDPASGAATSASSPLVPLLDDPILISNPDASDMARIDAEMGNSAVGRPVQIRYDEAALNREASALLASYPDLPYQNLHIDLERNQVILKGSLTVMGLPVNAQVVGTVVARNCLPQAQVTKISIAGLMTPAFVRDSISNIIADSLSWYPPDYPLCLEQIVIEQDRVTVYGSRR